MRLREIWDDEVEREEEEGGGGEGTLRNEGDSSSDEGVEMTMSGEKLVTRMMLNAFSRREA